VQQPQAKPTTSIASLITAPQVAVRNIAQRALTLLHKDWWTTTNCAWCTLETQEPLTTYQCNLYLINMLHDCIGPKHD